MSREGAEVGFDRLLVADIRQDLFEYRKFGIVARNRQTGLRHQRDEAKRLQRDRLAPCVRTADQ